MDYLEVVPKREAIVRSNTHRKTSRPLPWSSPRSASLV
jgi:hypothetical protein